MTVLACRLKLQLPLLHVSLVEAGWLDVVPFGRSLPLLFAIIIVLTAVLTLLLRL